MTLPLSKAIENTPSYSQGISMRAAQTLRFE
jgi:hypothetical protein